MTTRRPFIAPPDDERCTASLQSNRRIAREGARCMKRAFTNGLCRQHAKIAKEGLTNPER